MRKNRWVVFGIAVALAPWALVASVVIALLGCAGGRAHDEEEVGGVGGDLPVAGAFRWPFGSGTREEYLAFAITQHFAAWSSWGGGRHLAADVNAPSGTRVYSIADGIVRLSDEHSYRGYGNRCGAYGRGVVVEYFLPDGSAMTCVYGHVREGAYNLEDKTGLVPEGTVVHAGQYLARVADYWADTDGNRVCDDANWDHLHFGCRKGEFNMAEYGLHVKGYSGLGEDVDFDASGTARGGKWTNPDLFIANHQEIDDPEEVDPPEDLLPDDAPDDTLLVGWATPDAVIASRVVLSGRVTHADGSKIVWQRWADTGNSHVITANIPFVACERFEFSVEYDARGVTAWSCVGGGELHGSAAARWEGESLSVTTVTNGVGGCNLLVSAPCESEVEDDADASGDSEEDASSESSEEEEDGASEDGEDASDSDATEGSITCELSGGELLITSTGVYTEENLVDGPPAFIGWVAVGSDASGWYLSTELPPFYAIYNGPAYTHTVIVPATVDHFNLWVGSSAGASWYNLSAWNASGGGCAVESDDSGGLIITR